MSRLRLFLALSYLTIVASSPARSITLNDGLIVDATASYADVELCLTVFSTVCDTDATPVAGSVAISLDYPPGPTGISLHDFTFQLVDDVVLNLDSGVLGAFNSIGTGIDVTYADAGSPIPSVPVIGGAFTFTGVPADLTGQLHFMTTGALCSAFQLVGYLCDDVIDLSTVALDPVDMIGTVGVSGDDVSLTLELILAGPIDPTHPELGTLTIGGTISAVGVIPEPSTSLLLSLGMIGLAALQRRRSARLDRLAA